MQTRELAPGHIISRVIRGGWQIAQGHSSADVSAAIDDMVTFADAGITTFDCADIYTGVEELIGQFRTRYRDMRGEEALGNIRVHTKCVPDLGLLPTLQKSDVEATIDTSLKRLGLERLDLVQFHWWDYAQPKWIEAAGWLEELRQAGKIARIGATNFDTEHMNAIIDAGVPLVSMQAQYSLLDRRPEKEMVTASAAAGVSLLCYGTVAGGFLSDRWLGKAEPVGALENRSLVKYKLIIDDIGGWDLLQALLVVLRRIADHHGSDVATVASAAMLDRPGVAGVIVGARNRDHLAENLAICELSLAAGDMEAIDDVLAAGRPLDGDVYTLERDRSGRHGAIMKYDLNKESA